MLRPARSTDQASLIEVEEQATPNLSYVPHVFEMFVSDTRGEFSVAEIDGKVVACGKFTVVPDGSAWLETIRVLPAFQGMGIGKRFYERFFELASERNVTTMRMYTGTRNVVSKGLAERFGFRVAETFRGATISNLPASTPAITSFRQATEAAAVVDPLMANAAAWHRFLVMNRTFYKLTPALIAALVAQGQIYVDRESDSIIVMGARFMPKAALHVGHFVGDASRCLHFAQQHCVNIGAVQISCLYPSAADDVAQQLAENGFSVQPAEFIVMERQLL